MTHPTLPCFRQQHGAALIIALILLVIMSLMVTTSLRGTIMQERMSSNTYDRDLAFQSAEAGLRIGERQVENWVADGTAINWPNCDAPAAGRGGFYQNINGKCPQPLWESVAPGAAGTFWRDSRSDGNPGGNNIAFNDDNLSLAPFYIVELISQTAPCQVDDPASAPNCRRFRITSSSRNTDGRSQVILQSIYATE